MPGSTIRTPSIHDDSAAPASASQVVARYSADGYEMAQDHVAIEEPLQIRLAGEDVAVTMRTPGHDAELAAGFLYAEGIIAGNRHIEAIAHCHLPDGAISDNVINVSPTDRTLLEPRSWGRSFISSSSCGLCGKTSIEQLGPKSTVPNLSSQLRLQPAFFYEIEARLRAAQETFMRTGGLHAAAIFDANGTLIVLREDVGRHNAVDKVIGYALLNELLPLDSHILLVSSRASYEIVQKALMAGVQVLAVLSAPSSLAVKLAREARMTLVAFLRQARFNVYAGQERIVPRKMP